MMTKTCSKCKIEKDLKEFSKDRNRKDGLHCQCRECKKQYEQTHKEQRKKRNKQYCQTHKEQIQEYSRQYRQSRKELAREYGRKYGRKYYQTHKERAREQSRRCYQARKEQRNEKMKEYRQTCMGKYGRYRRGAKERNISFDLTLEQFCQYWQKPCSYCGSVIKTIGLDRVDNSKTKGYTIDNVVSCCEICNRMKLALSKQEFINHCKKIANNSSCSPMFENGEKI